MKLVEKFTKNVLSNLVPEGLNIVEALMQTYASNSVPADMIFFVIFSLIGFKLEWLYSLLSDIKSDKSNLFRFLKIKVFQNILFIVWFGITYLIKGDEFELSTFEILLPILLLLILNIYLYSGDYN
tara:strand:+ start:702 stop:1079 length:378 start_codon:yes stop_codon:yes gene_type:complete